MIRIKICGLTSQTDVESVNRYLPDYAGFVMAESRRRVPSARAEQLKQKLDPRIKAVGVFVNENLPIIIDLCLRGIIDVVQLHGDESETYIHQLKQSIRCPVIKAVRVQNAGQITAADRLPADFLLLDTHQPDQYGGSGQTFDWGIIPSLTKPYFLAGGLNAGNMKSAISTCHPFGVDISSGVETDRTKDEAKIREVIAMIRALN